MQTETNVAEVERWASMQAGDILSHEFMGEVVDVGGGYAGGQAQHARVPFADVPERLKMAIEGCPPVIARSRSYTS